METVGQSLIDGKLRWFRRVTAGDSVTEEDGVGFAPDCIRRALLEREGKWELVVLSGNRLKIVKKLRLRLGLDLLSASSVLKLMPGVVYVGTLTEAEWLAQSLVSEGATCSIRMKARE